MSEVRRFADGYIKVSYEEMYRIAQELGTIVSRIETDVNAVVLAAQQTSEWNTDSSEVVRELARAELSTSNDVNNGVRGLYTSLKDILSVYHTEETDLISGVGELPTGIIR